MVGKGTGNWEFSSLNKCNRRDLFSTSKFMHIRLLLVYRGTPPGKNPYP